GDDAFTLVVETVRAVRKATGLPVMVSVGAATDGQLDRLAAAGADWYACYQETHNRMLFEQLRVGQSYENRCRSKIAAKARGMLVEEGLLCGVGETSPDLLHSFDVMDRMGADQVRVMTFVPQPGTPLGDQPASSSLRELIGIALLRLVFPQLLIPASLDVDGPDGLRRRLDAGANVVTSLVPPGQGLAGVARHRLDIEDGRRTVEGIRNILDVCRLAPATHDAYRTWMDRRRGRGRIHDGRWAWAC
ncbi:MAG TPA: methylornithine synthase PylB, partial [Desulfosarcina sp.]|nr:methylornithine synthase PylB [Desulfosarcina sp.]